MSEPGVDLPLGSARGSSSAHIWFASRSKDTLSRATTATIELRVAPKYARPSTISLSLAECLLDPVGRERRVTQSHTGELRHCVGDCRRHERVDICPAPVGWLLVLVTSISIIGTSF